MMYAKPDELATELNRARFDQTEQARADSCLNAASSAIDAFLFGSDDPPDPRIRPGGQEWSQQNREDVRRACLPMAAQRWKDTDALFGTVGMADIGMLRAPRETDIAHLRTIVYLKTDWGIA